ncbi:MAG: hypothetical protein LBD23_13020 [Oscillospiraceae bacterium]|nr:hypothetical protein [Oscillospiraceae bacterium]
MENKQKEKIKHLESHISKLSEQLDESISINKELITYMGVTIYPTINNYKIKAKNYNKIVWIVYDERFDTSKKYSDIGSACSIIRKFFKTQQRDTNPS